MIALPFNDYRCLGSITEVVAELVANRDPVIVELAAQHRTTEGLANWIRSLPQRDDDGEKNDGPKVEACSPPQRLRIPAPDPNCVERAATFLAVAEMIDPRPVRQLATLELDVGLHTFPVENGAPVILDPRLPRNCADAAFVANGARNTNVTRRLRVQRLIGLDETKGVRGDLARARRAKALGHSTGVDGKPIDESIAIYERALAGYQTTLAELHDQDRDAKAGGGRNGASGQPVAIEARDAIEWTARLAETGAVNLRNGPSRVRQARNAMMRLVDEGAAPVDATDIDAMGWLLALAERAARLYGTRALSIVRTTAQAIADLTDQALSRSQRNLSLQIGDLKIKPNMRWLSSFGAAAANVGVDVGAVVLRTKLAQLGMGDDVVNVVEQELNREGLTLGKVARPPKIPTLANLVKSRAA